MTTVIALWITVDTGDRNVRASLDHADDVLQRASQAVKTFVSGVLAADVADEAIVYDDNGDEVFNGEF